MKKDKGNTEDRDFEIHLNDRIASKLEELAKRRYGSADQDSREKVINDIFDAADQSLTRQSTMLENAAAFLISLNPPRPIKQWAASRMVEEIAAWYLKH